MFYSISVTIDNEVYVVAVHVPEDELQHLSRKHESKNVVRFDITLESQD